jgi:TfoX/Sxy family transcriptional regulator of competence genes
MEMLTNNITKGGIMAYNAELDGWISQKLTGVAGISVKKMFGGVGYLLGGTMAAGVRGQDLILRLDPADGERLLQVQGFRPFTNHTGAAPMKGWVAIAMGDIKEPARLKEWLGMALAYAGSLPAK